ncbi:MAG: NAD(P)-dependent alcohol dehydrogenase [Betaproteobacteria bacterium]|nr:NAD(P)-dependent alcohol dehydrogenase [Betaproteobacteria bacterium]
MPVYRLERFGDIDSLVLHAEAPRSPGPGEVLVRVRATSLNFRDLALLHGQYPMSCRPNLVPLSDAAGEVVSVGDNVTRFKPGDRVANSFFPRWFGGRFPLSSAREQYGSDQDGWLIDQKVVSAEALVAIPPHLSFEEAATLPCAAVTAWTALAGITAGDTVLTQGSGGVSLFALQLAKLLGARVIATTSGPEKAERLSALGADEVIDYTALPEWFAQVRQLTEGLGVDRIVEVGGPGTLAQSIRAVAVGGEIAMIGFLAAGQASIDFKSLFLSGATLRRIAVGSRADFEAMNRAVTLHRLCPVIDRVFSFDQAREAWQHFDGRRNFGKVVIAHG